MAGPAVVRIGLWLLTVTQWAIGLWQLLAPRSFYDDFPIPGGPWVSLLPPYNEHLMTDVGGLVLAVGVVLLVAAVSMERRLVLTALAAYLAFGLPHWVFHATHLGGFPTSAAIGQTVALTAALALPLALMPIAVRSLGVAPGRGSDPPTAAGRGARRSAGAREV